MWKLWTLCPIVVAQVVLMYLPATASSSIAKLDGDPAFMVNGSKLFVEVGSTLVVNCTILPEYLNNHSSSMLLFYYQNKLLDRSSEYVQVLTEATLQLRYPKMDTGHHEHLYCFQTPPRKPLAEIDIDVARFPKQPYLTECVVEQWQNLTCSWGPSITEQYDWSHTTHVTYNLSWLVRTPGLPDEKSSLKINRTVPVSSYTWPSPTGGYMCQGEEFIIQLQASNAMTQGLGKPGPSFKQTIHPCTKVKPGPVSDVLVRNITASTVHLHWSAPQVPSSVTHRQFIYTLDLTAMGSGEELSTTRNVTSGTHVALNTEPFREYSVSVRALPAQGGHYSTPVQVSWHSLPAVPAKNPEMSPLGFEIHMDHGNCTHSMKKRITFYWQKLLPRYHNGPGLKYRIQLRYPPDTTWYTAERDTMDTQGSLCVDDTKDLVFKIVAQNSEGFADVDEATNILVSSSKTGSKSRPWFVVEGGQKNKTTLINVIWREDHSKDKTIEGQDVVLFWCLKGGKGCKSSEEVQWYRPSIPELGSHTLASHTKDPHLYRYGLAVTQPNSTGIHWASCIYTYNADPDPPSKLMVTPSENYGILDIGITVPECDSTKGYAKGFDVVYAEITQNGSCKAILQEGKLRRVYVPRLQAEPQSLVHHNLYVTPGSTVCVHVYSMSSGGHMSPLPVTHTPVQASQSWASPGAISGIVIAAVVFLVITVVPCVSYLRKKGKKITHSIPISRPQRHRGESCTSSTPVLDDTAKNYGRLMSTLSSDSGTESLSDDQLTPQPQPDIPRRLSMVPETSAVDDTDEIFEGSTVQTYHIMPTMAGCSGQPQDIVGANGGHEDETQYNEQPRPQGGIDNYAQVAITDGQVIQMVGQPAVKIIGQPNGYAQVTIIDDQRQPEHLEQHVNSSPRPPDFIDTPYIQSADLVLRAASSSGDDGISTASSQASLASSVQHTELAFHNEGLNSGYEGQPNERACYIPMDKTVRLPQSSTLIDNGYIAHKDIQLV